MRGEELQRYREVGKGKWLGGGGIARVGRE